MKFIFSMALLFLTLSCAFTRARDSSGEQKFQDSGPNPAASNLYLYQRESAQELNFIVKLKKLTMEKGIKVCYYLGTPSYFIEHLVPLYHVLPARFCGEKNSELVQKNRDLLLAKGFPNFDIEIFDDMEGIEKFLDESPNHFLISISGVRLERGHSNYFQLTHGVDQDHLYYHGSMDYKPGVRPTDDMAMIFTKFNEFNAPTDAEISAYYKLDKTKKTILYLPSEGFMEFFDKDAPEEVRNKTFADLLALKKQYNMIVRPHPLLPSYYLNRYRENFIIAPPGVFPSFVPFYKSADLVLSAPTAGATGATSRPELPLVVIRPRIQWTEHRVNLDEVLEKYKDIVLDEGKCIVQKDVNIDLVAKVYEAFNDPNSEEKIAARKKHFATWFACIDGYEDYRIFLEKILKSKIDTAPLLDIYKTFPIYKKRPLCI